VTVNPNFGLSGRSDEVTADASVHAPFELNPHKQDRSRMLLMQPRQINVLKDPKYRSKLSSHRIIIIAYAVPIIQAPMTHRLSYQQAPTEDGHVRNHLQLCRSLPDS
jgi:hypothetical protein